MRQIILILMIFFAAMLSCCSGDGAELLFDTAKLEELQDNHEHARRLYREIVDKYPDSEFAWKAKERLSTLGEGDKGK